MKFKKVFLWLGIVAVAVVAASLLGRNLLIKQGLQSGVRKSLGMELSISKINVGLFRTDIRVEGLRIYNPEGFEGELLADLPLIFIDYELGPMLKDKVHLHEVELNINEIVVVRNKNGEVNLNRLKPISAGTGKAPTRPAPEEEWEMQIDRLILTIDHVKFVDYFLREEPIVLEIPIGVDHEEFEDLNSIDEIVRVVVLRAIVNAGLANIGIRVEDLAVGIGGLGVEDMRRLEEFIEKASEALEEVDQEAKARLDEAEEKVEEFLEKLRVPEEK